MTISRNVKFPLVFFVLLSFSFISKDEAVSTYKLVIFEGSDWCVNCIRLDRNVLKHDSFVQFLEKENIEVQRIDFPQRKKLEPEEKAFNASIAEKYNFQGIFPTILLVESETNKFITLTYHDQGAFEFIQQIRNNILE